MKGLTEYILEGPGHNQHRLGAGSSGTVYDLGNGKIRKTLRVSKDAPNTPRHYEAKAIENWSKIKSGLKVIPYITDVDYDGYTIDKFQTPCK